MKPDPEPHPSPRLIRRRFEYFWERYPKKRSREGAWRRFEKIKPNGTLFRRIIDGLERCKASEDWQNERGKYVPYAATWLNNAGWLDEFEGPAPLTTLADAQREYDRRPGIF